MINLSKGQNVKLTKDAKKVRVGLSWDVNSSNGSDFDLDVLAIELDGKDGKCLGDEYVVYYNSINKTSDGKPTDPEGAVVHSGDNRNGEGSGDDEVIDTDLTKLNSKCKAILYVINIYEGKERGQNFGQVRNAKSRLYYANESVADLVYELDEDYSGLTCMEFCMLYLHNGEWKFKALGEGSINNLAEELAKYGLPCTGNA